MAITVGETRKLGHSRRLPNDCAGVRKESTMKRSVFERADVATSQVHGDMIEAPRSSWCIDASHRLEQAVQRRLLSNPSLRFSSLVIRRIPNGVCLEGVLENAADLDVCTLARSIVGVDEVRNHLVVHRSSAAE